MSFEKQILPPCPECGYSAMRVIESRTTQHSTRRRKGCDHCGYRTTTHEVSDTFFKQAKDSIVLIDKIKTLFNIDNVIDNKEQSSHKPIPCIKCDHNKTLRCAFDIPEYFTDDAYDCNYYINSKIKQ